MPPLHLYSNYTMNRMLLLAILSVLSFCSVVHGSKMVLNEQWNSEWKSFKVQFNRQFDEVTELTRRLIWEENVRYIQKHNMEYDLGKHSFFLGINQFADMTNEEFRLKYLGLKPVTKHDAAPVLISPENWNTLPDSVDWRMKGYVTEVKNQKQCGSCWAFSTTGSLEGQHFRKTRQLISFSEQQLVDCSSEFDNNGCSGGLMNNAFNYIKKFGIESEQSYPYTAKNGQCSYDRSLVVANCTGFMTIKRGDEKGLARAVATVGPISVAIDAGHRSFQLYKGGIYNEPSCSSSELDHGVLVVGFGSEQGHNYWLIKNSWGMLWGLSGYIKMTKDKHNQCGIASMASYPLV